MIYREDDIIPLYFSNKDIGSVPQEEVNFNPVIEEQYVVNPAPKTQTNLFTERTVIPASLVMVLPPEVPSIDGKVIINTDLLTKMYPTDEAIRIIDDIRNDVPLKMQVAEQVITSGIVKTPNQSELTNTVPTVALPVTSKNLTKIGGLKKRKSGIINSLTNFVYNVLYKSKK